MGMILASYNLVGKTPVFIIWLVRCVSGLSSVILINFNIFGVNSSQPQLFLDFRLLIHFRTCSSFTFSKSNILLFGTCR